MYIRPKLKDVCTAVELIADNFKPAAIYLKLHESGGFEVLISREEGVVEIVHGANLRKSVRKALDIAESKLHERRREASAFRREINSEAGSETAERSD